MSTPTIAIDGNNVPITGSHHVTNGWSFTRIATISNIPWTGGNWGPSGLVELVEPGLYEPDSASLLSYAMWYLMAYPDPNSGGGIIGGIGNSYTMPSVAWQGASNTGGVGAPWSMGTPLNLPAYPATQGPVVVFIESFSFEGIHNGVVRIRINYKGYPPLLLEMDSSLTSDTTNEDVFGNVILLAFTYPNPWYPNPMWAGQRVQQSGTYQRQLPQTSFTFKFTITGGYGSGETAWDVATWFSQFEGCVNSINYYIGSLTCLPHQLLCTKVSAQSKDGGTYYEMTMTFLYKPDPSGRPQQGWNKFLIYIDPNLGCPPPNLGASGTAFIQQYPAANFPSMVPYPI